MATLTAGVAVVDITPPSGLLLAGFAARTEPATGIHDPLTVRAVVVGDTAIVVADVIGLHEDDECAHPRALSAAGRQCHRGGHAYAWRADLDGGPAQRRCRSGVPAVDRGWLRRSADTGCCYGRAVADRRGHGRRSGCSAQSPARRRADRPALPVLRIRDAGGEPHRGDRLLCLPSDGAGRRQPADDGDFPHFVRAAIEAEHPGAVAVFLNGCAGDVNIGHTAHGSVDAGRRCVADASKMPQRAGRQDRQGGACRAGDADRRCRCCDRTDGSN